MCIGIRTRVWTLLFYSFIVAIWVSAAAHIAIGIYLAVENPTLNYGQIFIDYDKEIWDAAVYTFIAVGACLVGLGILGCCGAKRVINCFLLLFGVTMIIFLGIELVIVILAGVFQGDVKSGLRTSMETQVIEDYVSETATDEVSKDWNSMQQSLKCCASNYYTDYFLYSEFYKTTNQFVPYTCCEGEEINYDVCLLEARGNISVDDIQYLYRDGCFLQMQLLIEDQTSMIVATGCIVAAIQFGCILIGCMLRDNYKKTGKFQEK